MPLFAVDVGYRYVKGKGDKECLFSSEVGEPTKVLTSIGSKDKYSSVVYRDSNQELFIGELAKNQSKIIYFSLSKDKLDDKYYTMLVNTAAYFCLSGDQDIDLITGLPLIHYSVDNKNLLETKLRGMHIFSVGSSQEDLSQRILNVKSVRIIPQPMGAFFDFILDDSGVLSAFQDAKNTDVIIDIGFYTTGLLGVKELNPLAKYNLGLTVAMNTVYTMLIDYLAQHFGVSFDFYQVDEFIKNESINIKGKTYSLSSTMEDIYRKTAQQIYVQMKNKYQDSFLLVDKFVFTGGGSISLFPYFKELIPNSFCMTDPQMSIVRGYHKFGMRKK